jgi:peptidoglycan/LPS O-acetylase OafA/YrhL
MSEMTDPASADAAENPAVGSEARRRIGYVPELDGLRGLAASFVFAYHMSIGILASPNEIRGTFVFMDMFFVLSGFLITALLLKEHVAAGRIRLLSFYRRRAMRLLPALYFLLVVHAVYAYFNNYPWDVEKSTLFHAVVYGVNFQITNLFSPVSRGLTQLWSLGVEEQFYVLWPLIVIGLLALGRRLRFVVGVLVALIVAVVVYRYLLWDPSMAQTTRWYRLYTHTDTRADSLLVGALLGFLWVSGKVPRGRFVKIVAWAAVPVLVWFLVAVDLSSAFPYKGGLTLMAVAWAFVILACVDTNWGGSRFLQWKVLRRLGEVSYGIYIWHVPAQWAVLEHMGDSPVILQVLAAIALTAVVVLISWFCIERPFLQWKNRIDTRQLAEERAKAAAAGSSAT